VVLGGLRLLLPFPTQKEKTLGPLRWSQVCSGGLRFTSLFSHKREELIASIGLKTQLIDSQIAEDIMGLYLRSWREALGTPSSSYPRSSFFVLS
jgi:hypothetical protein